MLLNYVKTIKCGRWLWLIYPYILLPCGHFKPGYYIHKTVFIQITLFLTFLSLLLLPLWGRPVASTLAVTQTVNSAASLHPVITSLLHQYSPSWQPCYPTTGLYGNCEWPVVETGWTTPTGTGLTRHITSVRVCARFISQLALLFCYRHNSVNRHTWILYSVWMDGIDTRKVDWNNTKSIITLWHMYSWPCVQEALVQNLWHFTGGLGQTLQPVIANVFGLASLLVVDNDGYM